MNPGLYLVSTPIGNLDDITLRAINVLKNSNLILCENTTNSKKLLKRYDIKTSLSKYTDHDFNKKKDYIYKLLKSNQVISLISDSGSPLISDPGNQLINFLFQIFLINHFHFYLHNLQIDLLHEHLIKLKLMS